MAPNHALLPSSATVTPITGIGMQMLSHLLEDPNPRSVEKSARPARLSFFCVTRVGKFLELA
jgi:hypothetical protein